MNTKTFFTYFILFVISSALFGCALSSYYSGSDNSLPDLADGPRWPKGNSAYIDNVFPQIIFNENIKDNDNLTSLQKSEYSNYSLLGKDIFITTRVSDVKSYNQINGSDLENDSWKPNERIGGVLFLYPIFYYFKFSANSPDTSSLSQYSKGQFINIKGKLEKVIRYVSIDNNSIALQIYVEDCEFFDPSDY